MKRVAVLLFALGVVSLARADIGPPAGKKSVPVTTVVEAPEDLSDYAFFAVSYSSSPGPPPHGGTSVSVTLHFFVQGTTIKATGDRRSGGNLYAVPKTVVEKNIHWKGFAADFAKQNPPKQMSISTSDDSWAKLGQAVKKGEVPGAISIRFGGGEEIPTNDERTAVTETYRIVRTPAGVAFVKPDEPAPTGGRSEGDPSLTPGTFPWKWLVAGGAVFAAILLGGLWLVVRGRKAG
jgi:hypothetical protein